MSGVLRAISDPCLAIFADTAKSSTTRGLLVKLCYTAQARRRGNQYSAWKARLAGDSVNVDQSHSADGALYAVGRSATRLGRKRLMTASEEPRLAYPEFRMTRTFFICVHLPAPDNDCTYRADADNPTAAIEMACEHYRNCGHASLVIRNVQYRNTPAIPTATH